jgi:hypothetical protein
MKKVRKEFNRKLINGKLPITYQDIQQEVEGSRNPAIARAIPEKYMKPIEGRIQHINLNYGLDKKIPNLTLLISNESSQYGLCKTFVAEDGDLDEELKAALDFDFEAVDYYMQQSIDRYRAAKKTRVKRENQRLAWNFLLQVLTHYKREKREIFKFKKDDEN